MRLRFAILVLLAVSLAGCGKPKLTGTYVGKSGDSVVLLDLVQAEGGQVTGRLAGVSLKPDGSISDYTSAVSGLTDGRSVSLAAKSTSLLPVTVQITGKREGRHLKVSAGDSLSSELVKSDVTTFHNEAAKLRKRSSIILAARAAAAAEQAAQVAAQQAHQQAAVARATLLQTIMALMPRVDQMSARLGSIAAKGAAMEAAYTKTTEQMVALLERERSLTGDARSYQRGQISYAIQQNAFAADRAHNQVQSSQIELGGSLTQLGAQADAALASCRDLSPETTEPSLQTACADLGTKVKAMIDLAKQGAQNLRALEATYEREAQRQRQITDEATRIQ
ncbi:hypothetical protein [Phenylobacterium sp.]|uniref:hypothetical protein n=1 Tax=Phenylobacterium sp. TaxID=1871053 RepID=UPI0027216638|nr:hypothetical protein [Phenylobacterium sp.]MDO8799425.1 hypothetical protein [Phenylobacterium sp.]